ncbi:MAG: 30S ribosomal protein S17 [Candidatus Micrarchaeia archaeon]
MNCEDPKCPIHGHLKIHSATLEGKVISNKAKKSVTIARDYAIYVKKYERYIRKTSKIKAYLPSCMSVNIGDTVKVASTRRLSKTKSFVVIEVISNGNAVESSSLNPASAEIIKE